MLLDRRCPAELRLLIDSGRRIGGSRGRGGREAVRVAHGVGPTQIVVCVESRIVGLVERGKCPVDAAVVGRVGQLGDGRVVGLRVVLLLGGRLVLVGTGVGRLGGRGGLLGLAVASHEQLVALGPVVAVAPGSSAVTVGLSAAVGNVAAVGCLLVVGAVILARARGRNAWVVVVGAAVLVVRHGGRLVGVGGCRCVWVCKTVRRGSFSFTRLRRKRSWGAWPVELSWLVRGRRTKGAVVKQRW